jgi:uncharacterized membrane protein YczE
LGVSPWNVFYTGLVNKTPIRLGQANMFTSIAIVLISCLLGVRPGIVTVYNTFAMGYWIDFVMSWKWLAEPSQFYGRMAFLVLGTVIFGVGVGGYINIKLGAGPRDALMLGMVKKTRWSIRSIRTVLEVSVLVIGVIMGGQLGFGTLFYALTIGPVVQWSIKRFKAMGHLLQFEEKAKISAEAS